MPFLDMTLDETDEITLDDSDVVLFTAEMTDAALLSLFQFNNRAFVRSLPQTLDGVGELAHLVGLYSGIEIGSGMQITSIVCGWYIPGATVGERYQAGIVPNVNGLAAESYAAGAVVAEGRFK